MCKNAIQFLDFLAELLHCYYFHFAQFKILERLASILPNFELHDSDGGGCVLQIILHRVNSLAHIDGSIFYACLLHLASTMYDIQSPMITPR